MGYNNNKVLHYVFTDVETTGLVANEDEILSIGIVICKVEDFSVVAENEWYVKPEHIETASPRALEVNGYTPEKWAANGERPLIEVLPEVARWLRRGEFAGHNCPFDVGFIWTHAARLATAGFPGKPWSPLDTREWAKLLSGPGITPNNKLDALCDYYALPRGQYHGALEDAHLSRLAAKAMRDQFLRGGEALGPMGKAAAKIGAHAILGGLISKGPHDMETARVAATTAAVDRTSADEEP